jgi:sortase A
MVRRLIERVAWVVGLLALGTWALQSIAGPAAARRDVDRFLADSNAAASASPSTPDFLLWSTIRIQAWRAAQTEPAVMPTGVLRIRRLSVEAPIYDGTGEGTLNRGVGHIDGTPVPGASGNSGLAAHRDSYFRALKDIAAGDAIEIVTRASIVTYRVERTWIVAPDDVWVLDPTPVPAVTLVTCYPFYFIGSAPQRFIVRALETSIASRKNTGNTPGGS